MVNQQADGSVVIDTQLDTEGFKADSAELKKALKSLNSKMEHLGPTFQKACKGNANAIVSFKSKANDLKDEISDIETKMQKLGEQQLPSAEYSEVTEQIKKQQRECEKLIAKQKELNSGKLGEYNSERAAIVADTDKSLEHARTDEQAKNVLAMEKITLEQLDKKYASILAKAQQYKDKIAASKEQQTQLNAKLAQMKKEGTANVPGKQSAEYQQLNSQLNNAKAKLKEMKNSGRLATAEFAKSSTYAKKINSATRNIGNTLKGVVNSGVKKMLSGFKNVSKQITGMRKKLTRIALVMIGMRGVMGVIRQLATSAREQNEQLSNQLNALKGIMGSAFTPIISTIINGLSTIVAFIDRIYSAFTGISFIAKYNAKQATKMAESTSGAAKAAKEYKRQLAGFDELNVLSDSPGDSGGGGDSGLAAFETPDMSPFLESIISQIKAGDWYGVGVTIAGGINSALSKINWDSIQTKVNTFCTNLGTAVNGFIATLDWALVGDSVAQAINTITGAVNSFVDTVDWQNAGKGIGDALNALVKGVDGEALGKTLSAKLKVLTETLYGFFETFDAKALGKKIGGIVNAWFANIDWSHIGSNISSLIKSVFDLGSGFLASLDEEKLAQDIKDFFSGIDWKGIWDSIVGFVDGAITSVDEFLTALFGEGGADTIEAIAAAIVTVVVAVKAVSAAMEIYAGVQAVVNAVMTASPTTWIIVGIVAALAALVAIIVVVVKHWDQIKEVFQDFGTKLKDLGEKIKNWASDLKDKIVNWFSERINDIKEFGTNLSEKFKEGIGNIWNKIKEKFETFKTSITTWFTGKAENFKKFGSDLIGKIKSGIGNMWSAIKEKFTTFWTNIKSWFAGKAENFKKFGSDLVGKIKSGIGNLWSTVKEKFTTFWTNIKNWFTNKVESFKGLGKNIVDGIKNGIKNNFSAVIDMIKSKINGMVDTVKDILGIHSPSRVFYSIGKFSDKGLENALADGIPSLLKTAAGIAKAITGEFENGDYSVPLIAKGDTSLVSKGMSNFADTITDGFTSLIDRLQAIASGVTFVSPVVANGLVPYGAKTADDSSGITDAIFKSNDELETVIAQLINNGVMAIVEAIKVNGKDKGLSKTELAEIVISEINRRTRVLGKSPLKV